MNTSFSDRKGVSDQSSYYVNLWAAVNSFLNPTSPLYEADGNYTECINNQYPNLVRERGMKVNNQKQYRLLLNPWAEFKWWDISFKSNNQLDFLNSLS